MLIQRRIELFCALPFEKFDGLKLKTLTRDIGMKWIGMSEVSG